MPRVLPYLMVLGLLAACTSDLASRGEPLRLLSSRLPNAIVAEPYQVVLNAVGGLRPYHFELENGTLPPGLTLQNGTLRGTPTAIGRFAFSVSVSDANLSQTVENFELAVVEPPLPALVYRPPATEVRNALTLRARVENARSLVGLRSVVTWDPASWRLREGSVVAARTGLALLSEAAKGSLQVDLAVLAGGPPGGLSGNHELFRFVLEPLATPVLAGLASRTEFVSLGLLGEHRFEFNSAREGPALPAPGTAPGAPSDEGLPELPDLPGSPSEPADPADPDTGEGSP